MNNSKLILNKTRLTQLQDDQLSGIVGGIEGTGVEEDSSCKKKSCGNDSSISVEV